MISLNVIHQSLPSLFNVAPCKNTGHKIENIG
jgi:hypothetical protein